MGAPTSRRSRGCARPREAPIPTLADSGDPRFRTLDTKLQVALSATIKADCPILYTKVQTLESEAWERNAFVTGRQLVWLIYDHFRLNANMKSVHSLDEIVGLSWLGDN